MKKYQTVLAFLVGLGIALGAGWYALVSQERQHTSEEYHIHVDFKAYLAGQPLDLSDPVYMSNATHKLHEDVHLHDENADVVHFHGKEIPLSEFFASLGFTLTDSCFTTKKASYCTTATSTLTLFVNEVAHKNAITYVPQDGDKVLLYYGVPNAPELSTYFTTITNDACIYSGTCPERGLPPPESCGLTCDI